MSARSRNTALGIAGLAVTAVFGGVIAWGRLRSVEAPRHGTWPGVMLVCADEGVSRRDVSQAHAHLVDHGFRVRILAVGSDCTPRDGLATVRVDPTLDVGTGLGDGWDGGNISTIDADDEGTVWGRTQVTQTQGGVILRADVALHPSQHELSTTHELLHALGWGHPVAPPTGHVLHPLSPGLDDWRGVEGP